MRRLPLLLLSNDEDARNDDDERIDEEEDNDDEYRMLLLIQQEDECVSDHGRACGTRGTITTAKTASTDNIGNDVVLVPRRIIHVLVFFVCVCVC